MRGWCCLLLSLDKKPTPTYVKPTLYKEKNARAYAKGVCSFMLFSFYINYYCYNLQSNYKVTTAR